MKMARFASPLLAALAFALAALLAGCVTSYSATEPLSAAEALVVGQVRLVATGFPGAMGANGVYAQEILVTLRSLETGRVYGVRSQGAAGLFSLASPAPGRYVLVGFAARLPAGWGTSQLIRYRPARPIVFVVRAGVVNNLGLVVWHLDQASGRDWEVAGYGYANVRESFRAQFARSAWVRFRWEAREVER